ncbi:MAG: hypothetical protein R2729_14240 [Bryobacteraceae bacterium]
MLLIVGGHSRNVGKTAVAAGIIAALPKARWTAMKITQTGHGICSQDGEPCHCGTDYEHPFAIVEEREASQTDSGRFLAAGARRAYWVRTAAGQLPNALPGIRSILDKGGNIIVESNSLLNYIVPDIYLVVLDFAVADMKASARRFLTRADAFVASNSNLPNPWGVPERWLHGVNRFETAPPQWVSADCARFVADRMKRLR